MDQKSHVPDAHTHTHTHTHTQHTQIHHAKRNRLPYFSCEVNDNQGRNCTFSGVCVIVSWDIL